MQRPGRSLGGALLCLALALVPAISRAQAVASIPKPMPLDPDVIERARTQGKAMPLLRTEANFVSRGGRTVNAATRPQAPLSQTVKSIVILVSTTDNPPGGPTTRYSPAVFDSMLFGRTYVRGGADSTTDRTLRNFYDEISYGSVDVITLDMTSSAGWMAAPHDYVYYCEADEIHKNGFGPYPRNVQRLVMDAVLAANPYVDFSQYAIGGIVQNLFVVHSGSGAEWNGGPTLIWSHAWSIDTDDGWGTTPPNLYVDGVKISGYSMEPECGGNTTGEGGPVTGPYLPTVGVYAHEFGHVIGLPDEYDYGYESAGTGQFSLMAGGSWNRYPNVGECSGNSPAHPSAWGVAALGFVAPVEVTGCLPGASIPPIVTTNAGAVYRLTNPASAGKEYWLVENRQQLGFDAGLVRLGVDAHGIVIYHVDENVFDRTYWRPNEAECVSSGVYQGTDNCDCSTLPPNPSNGEKWYGISVEQADGLYQLELDSSHGGNRGGWQDFYNSITGVTRFDATTVPNTTSYYGCTTSVSVSGISGSTGTMTADLFGPAACQTSLDSLAFGTVLVGTYRDTTFTITNSGAGTLTGSVSESCDHYSIVSGGGAYSLAAGQHVTVTVRFAPTVAGTHACAVETGSPCCDDIACAGMGENPPACVVTPEALDFGTVTVGSAAIDSFKITNTGGGSLASDVSEACDHYTIISGGGPYSIAAGQHMTVTVRFAPTVVGTHGCSVETGTASCSDVACTGVGENPPACLVVPAALDFGTVTVGSAASDSFTITNTGGGSLAVDVSEACDHYSLVSGGGPYSLAPGQHVTVTVRFAPTVAGTHGCSVETGTASCSDVACTGVGENPPACAVVPAALDFGTVTVGSAASDSFRITNTGGGSLTGSVSETCSHYSIVSGGGAYSLAAGQHVTVTVRFAPDSVGAHGCTVETGATLCSDVDLAGIGGWPSSVQDDGLASIPAVFYLDRNMPNPSNPSTDIAYGLPVACHVRLEIYDAMGHKLATLVDEHRSAGRQIARWDGRNSQGAVVPNGIYFCRMRAGDFAATRKMILLK